jgi:hypothetical protein
MRLAPLLAVVFAWTVVAVAADRPSAPRRAPGVDQGVQGDEPDLGDGSDGADEYNGEEPGDEPGTGSDDDPGASRGAPSRPRPRLPDRPPSMPSMPGPEEEEPPPLPEQAPVKDGPAEPASAMQPLGTE